MLFLAMPGNEVVFCVLTKVHIDQVHHLTMARLPKVGIEKRPGNYAGPQCLRVLPVHKAVHDQYHYAV